MHFYLDGINLICKKNHTQQGFFEKEKDKKMQRDKIVFEFAIFVIIHLHNYTALSFYVTKTVLVWPNLFGLDHNDLVMTKMNWSGPNVIHFGRKSRFGPDKIHFGHDHFILVETKSLWSSQNQFGQTKTILDRPKLFWSHRRTRHT